MQASVEASYLHIARDIASRIAKGEFPEGSRLLGRSVMAAQYKVSPETIRRSFHQLAEMKVLSIKPQSGATVVSADNALRYLTTQPRETEAQDYQREFTLLAKDFAELSERAITLSRALARSMDTYAAAADKPLPNYEIPIPCGSSRIGASLGSLDFWQKTGATVVAIRRGKKVIVSPGPHAELYEGDVLIAVGTPASIVDAERLVGTAKEESDD